MRGITFALLVLANLRSVKGELALQPIDTALSDDELRTTTSAWADVNQDGLIDVYLTNYDGPSQLYIQAPGDTPRFEPISGFSSPTVNEYGFGATWGDYDNDGDPDLFVSTQTITPLDKPPKDALFENLGNQAFLRHIPQSARHIAVGGGNSMGAAWGDFDQNGLLDLYVATWRKSPNLLYINEGDGVFTDSAKIDNTQTRGKGESVAAADFDNDGDLDIAVANGSGVPDYIQTNEGEFQFRFADLQGFSWIGKSSTGITWADYDNDGDLDVHACYLSGHRLYENLGKNRFQVNRLPNDENSQSCSGAAWGDLDNDGDLDLVVATGRGFKKEANHLYLNQGEGLFTLSPLDSVTTPSSSYSVSLIDLNNDGWLDLFLANGDNEEEPDPSTARNTLLLNKGGKQHFLRILCEGSTSNRSAIGARVQVVARIKDQLVSQMRFVPGGAGSYTGGQPSFILHFGLGDASRVEKIQVRWPNGGLSTYGDLPINETLRIIEPERLQMQINDDGSASLKSRASIAGYFVLQESIDLQIWTDSYTLPRSQFGTFQFTIPSLNQSCGFFRIKREPLPLP